MQVDKRVLRKTLIQNVLAYMPAYFGEQACRLICWLLCDYISMRCDVLSVISTEHLEWINLLTIPGYLHTKYNHACPGVMFIAPQGTRVVCKMLCISVLWRYSVPWGVNFCTPGHSHNKPIHEWSHWCHRFLHSLRSTEMTDAVQTTELVKKRGISWRYSYSLGTVV